MKLAVFGFAGTNSEIIATELSHKTGGDLALLTGARSIKAYRQWLIIHQPTHILGLGRYTGRDREQLRLETSCSSIFGREIAPHLELTIQPWLTPNDYLKLARGIGNSYCNAASWAICSAINDRTLAAKYSFIHVPSTYSPEVATIQLLQQF